MAIKPPHKITWHLIALIATCALGGLHALAQTPISSADASASVTAGSDYKISPNDLIDVKVVRDELGSGQMRVSKNGTIKHPYMGVIKLAGQTENEAARTLERALRNGYLKNPQVTVTVTRFATMRVVILGHVNAPNTYEVPANKKLTLLEAIGLAKGFKDGANKRKVYITRVENGKRWHWPNDVKNAKKQVLIKDGDVIEVKEGLF